VRAAPWQRTNCPRTTNARPNPLGQNKFGVLAKTSPKSKEGHSTILMVVVAYLGQFVGHFAHPREREDGAVTFGVEVALEVQMHFLLGGDEQTGGALTSRRRHRRALVASTAPSTSSSSPSDVQPWPCSTLSSSSLYLASQSASALGARKINSADPHSPYIFQSPARALSTPLPALCNSVAPAARARPRTHLALCTLALLCAP
jgi:hypothetical protein